MNRKWMNKTLLALSVQMAVGVVYAAEELGTRRIRGCRSAGNRSSIYSITVCKCITEVTANVQVEESALGEYEAVDEQVDRASSNPICR